MIVAGVLSGTSLDGIDVAVVDLEREGERLAFTMLAFETVPFEPGLRARLLAAFPPRPLDALAFSALHADVGSAFGAAVARVARGRHLDLIASHGITLAHDGAAHRTLQIGDPFRIREAVGCAVAYDFRSADTAAGGHGAPLVPYLDALLFADADETRIALNLGGIANLTVLRAGAAPHEAIAFDSGPANLPIDAYVRSRALHADGFDRDGVLARAGCVCDHLLGLMLDDPYFEMRPPKSTGRERFGEPFLARFGAMLDRLAPADAVATLSMLTVRSVARAIRTTAPEAAVAIVSGGGAHNTFLLEALRKELPMMSIVTPEAFGVEVDSKEALLFAVLGFEFLRGRAANVPNVTGAAGSRLLGAYVPRGERWTAALRREEQA